MNRAKGKRKPGQLKKEEKLKEVEDTPKAIESKCKRLAALLKKSKLTLIYTGAGISTAASIPDYRGPNGVWTLAEQGKPIVRCADIVESCPTSSHMVLKELVRSKYVRHILSQNCDGLHLRSGLPQNALSEIHGNMYIEVCHPCSKQFIRPFDCTEKSKFRSHATGRQCDRCHGDLHDTIVHFGEVGKAPWPLNWKGTTELVEEADVILCLGTSLAVLKSYNFLWPAKGSKTKLVIVNLQWTPKDRVSHMKIHGRCDDVLLRVAELLDMSVKHYCRDCDPVLNPRRNARTTELRDKMTDCSCHIRAPRVIARDEDAPARQPGWWTAGLAKAHKRHNKAETDAPAAKRKPGRPRKVPQKLTDAKVIKSVLTEILDQLDPPQKRRPGRPRKNGSSDVYQMTSLCDSPLPEEEESKPSSSSATTTNDSDSEIGEVLSSSEDSDDDEYKIPGRQMSTCRPSFISENVSRRRSRIADRKPVSLSTHGSPSDDDEPCCSKMGQEEAKPDVEMKEEEEEYMEQEEAVSTAFAHLYRDEQGAYDGKLMEAVSGVKEEVCEAKSEKSAVERIVDELIDTTIRAHFCQHS